MGERITLAEYVKEKERIAKEKATKKRIRGLADYALSLTPKRINFQDIRELPLGESGIEYNEIIREIHRTIPSYQRRIVETITSILTSEAVGLVGITNSGYEIKSYETILAIFGSFTAIGLFVNHSIESLKGNCIGKTRALTKNPRRLIELREPFERLDNLSASILERVVDYSSISCLAQDAKQVYQRFEHVKQRLAYNRYISSEYLELTQDFYDETIRGLSQRIE